MNKNFNNNWIRSNKNNKPIAQLKDDPVYKLNNAKYILQDRRQEVFVDNYNRMD